MSLPTTKQLDTVLSEGNLTDENVNTLLTNVAPSHPALRRLHNKLNTSEGTEAAITSYDRMHHRHNRS